jgi:hypothetical protein
VHRARLDDRRPGGGQPAEPLAERLLGERALGAGALEGPQRGVHGLQVGVRVEGLEPIGVQLDPRPQVAERLGVDDHARVDRLAAFHPRYDADQRPLEDLAHVLITSGTSGARLASWST